MGNESSSHSKKKPSSSPIERELALRRRRLLERSRLEQQQWRARRLHDVVLVLLEREEVFEGIPIGFQVPEGAEVPARRPVRIPRGGATSEQARRRLRQTMAAMEEDESNRYDAEMLKVIRAPLEELLAEGRPEDCLPAPDIMQLLLDGRELSLSDEDEEEMTTATEEDEDDAPLSSMASSFAGRNSGRATPGNPNEDDYPIERGRRDTSSISRGTSRSGSSVGRAHPDDCPIRLGSFSGGTSRTSSFAGSSGLATPASANLDTPSERARHRKNEAIIRELRHERRQQHKKYRRRTAEELYGEGCTYAVNKANHKNMEDSLVGLTLTAAMMKELSSTSHRITDVLSPLTPFRRGGSERDAKSQKGNHNSNSAFPSVGDDDDSETHIMSSTRKRNTAYKKKSFSEDNDDADENTVSSSPLNDTNSSNRLHSKNERNESVEPLFERT